MLNSPICFDDGHIEILNFYVVNNSATKEDETDDFNSPLKKALLTGFHPTAKHIAAKAVSPSSETMRTS